MNNQKMMKESETNYAGVVLDMIQHMSQELEHLEHYARMALGMEYTPAITNEKQPTQQIMLFDEVEEEEPKKKITRKKIPAKCIRFRYSKGWNINVSADIKTKLERYGLKFYESNPSSVKAEGKIREIANSLGLKEGEYVDMQYNELIKKLKDYESQEL